jgi:hypothetical protein
MRGKPAAHPNTIATTHAARTTHATNAIA